jgi:hypothetical protein
MKYKNFDIEASGYTKDDNGVEQFVVKVLDSPAGQQRMGERVTLDPAIRHNLGPLERRELDQPGLVAFGQALGCALFPPNARAFYDQSRVRIGGDMGLRIRLRLETFALADLPWEYVYLSPRDSAPGSSIGLEFLVLDRHISLVRYELLGQPPGTLDPVSGSQLRMVMLLSSPSDFPELKVTDEADRIRKVMKDSAPNVQLEVIEHTTPEKLSDALIDTAHIFHFAGHGEFKGEMGLSFGSVEGKGFVVLEDEDGTSRLFASNKLAIALSGSGVRLAVLGACKVGRRDGVNAWTGVVPALMRADIPAAIGMQFTVGDATAITFSRNLYRALVAGQSVDEAVSNGRRAVYNSYDEPERDWGTPVLYLRADEGVLFPAAAGATTISATSPAPATQQPAPQAATQPANSHPSHPRPPVTQPPEAQPQGAPAPSPDRVTLRNFIVKQFKSAELAVLCTDLSQMLVNRGMSTEQFDMGIVSGSDNIVTQALDLIGFMQRRGWYEVLVESIRAARPGMI